jgi:hypothetical protein
MDVPQWDARFRATFGSQQALWRTAGSGKICQSRSLKVSSWEEMSIGRGDYEAEVH